MSKQVHSGITSGYGRQLTTIVDPSMWKPHPRQPGVYYAEQTVHAPVLAQSLGCAPDAGALLNTDQFGIHQKRITGVTGMAHGSVYGVNFGGKKSDGTQYPISPREPKMLLHNGTAFECDGIHMAGQTHENTPAIYDHATHSVADVLNLGEKWKGRDRHGADHGTIKLTNEQTGGNGARRLVPVEHDTNPVTKLLENKGVHSNIGHSGVIEHDGVSYHDVDEGKFVSTAADVQNILEKQRSGSDPFVLTHYLVADKIPENNVVAQYDFTLGSPVAPAKPLMIKDTSAGGGTAPTKASTGYQLDGAKPL